MGGPYPCALCGALHFFTHLGDLSTPTRARKKEMTNICCHTQVCGPLHCCLHAEGSLIYCATYHHASGTREAGKKPLTLSAFTLASIDCLALGST